MSASGLLLHCLPHAGATAAAFGGWAGALAPEIEVRPVTPSRYVPDDAARCTVAAAAEALAEELSPSPGVPYAFYGHSLGGIISFETIRALLRRGCDPPRRLLVSGCPPPEHATPSGRRLHTLPDGQFLAAVSDLGELPREAAEDTEIRDMILPGLRTDYRLAETYRHRAGPPLPCPITAMYGKRDDLVDPARIGGWQRHTDRPLSIRVLSGDHFLLRHSAEELLSALRANLLAAPASNERER